VQYLNFFLTPILLFFLNVSFAQKEIPLDSVSNYVGELIKVCDKVSSTYQSTNLNKMSYIHFGGNYPEQIFSIIIFPKDLENFQYIPTEYLKDKNICVTGMSSEYKGKPQIVATFEEQITIVE
jgi:hypothetical protein